MKNKGEVKITASDVGPIIPHCEPTCNKDKPWRTAAQTVDPYLAYNLPSHPQIVHLKCKFNGVMTTNLPHTLKYQQLFFYFSSRGEKSPDGER